jgi:uncharacterized tellurite resistance protein B-like protein
MTTKLEADWILKVMAAMAAADHRLDAREVTLIQSVYEELTGEPVDVSGVVSAVQVYARKDVLEELSEVAGSLSTKAKAAILRGAYETILANSYVSQAERDTLGGIAAALQLSGDDMDAVLAQAKKTQLL